MKARSASPAGGPAPIEYEPRLLEDAVRWAIEQGGLGVQALKLQRLRLSHRRKLDALYRLPQGEQREAAFRHHFATLFAELGMVEWIPGCLEPFPRLRSELECVVVRAAAGPDEPGAELWESQERRGEGIPAYLVIAISGSGLRSRAELRAALLPDLLRAADMLDPKFGYRRTDLKSNSRGEKERARAVYQQLWELSARARLHARGVREDGRLRADAEELIGSPGGKLGGAGGGPHRNSEELLAALCDDISHQRLLILGGALAAGARNGATESAARCPLCHYPTTDWTSAAALRAVAPEIHTDFPGWSPAKGCCGHCAERYALLSEGHGAGG